MKKTFRLAAAAVFFLAVAAGLSAQSHLSFREEYESLRALSGLHLGPVRIVPVFRLTDVGYDSNVYFREEGTDVVSDLTATLSPEIRACWLVGGSLILSATENPEYVAYAREMALRSFANSIAGSLRWLALRHFSLAGEYHSLSHVRRSLSEFEHRIRDTATGGKASLFFETARGTAIGFAGTMDDYRYKDVGTGTVDDVYGLMLDRRESSAAFEFDYRIFTASTVFASAGATRYDFLHPESAWRDGWSYQAWAGLRFPLSGRARGAIRLGWKTFRPDTPDRTPFSGFVAATDVALRAGHFGLTLGLDRDNAFSYNETAFYYVDTRARAGLSLYLAEWLRLDGAIQYGTLVYPDPQEVWHDGAYILVERREDTQQVLSVGPVVRVGGTTGIGLTFNLYSRTSNAPGFDVRRNFVGAFVTYEF
jgi:hypothetical protein